MKRDRRGSALVEFALVLPILLAVSLIVFDLGFVVYDKLAVMAAAREGGRAAAVTDSTADGREMCYKMAERAGLHKDRVMCSVSDLGDYYVILAEYRSQMLVPGLPALLGGDEWTEIKVGGKAIFRGETAIGP